MEEMYRLNIVKLKEKHLKFCLTLRKFGSCDIFSTNNEALFQSFCVVLRKFCILADFDDEYEIINELGAGYFAKVYKVRNNLSNQTFAAKMFIKNDKLTRNKVIFLMKILRKPPLNLVLCQQ